MGGQILRLLHVMTVPQSLGFLTGQVGYMKENGFEVHAISSNGDFLDMFARREGVAVYPVDMLREITPLKDLVSVYQLWRLMRRIHPQIVHSHTPKGGLLGMLAATLAGVPIRIYHIRGLPFMTARGWKRNLLRLTEWMSCSMAHRVLAVSHSMRSVAIESKLCRADKIKVMGGGSGNGVDAEVRFASNRWQNAREEVRARHGIPAEAVVVGFVGRIVRDKGISELVASWNSLRDEFPDAHLIVVGPFEDQDPIPATTAQDLKSDCRIHLVGSTSETPKYYASMDVLVLPTYREGFPNVALEAAAMELPVVATRIPGCVDAVEEGVTGLLVPAMDSEELAQAIRTYLSNPQLRLKHGAAGRKRVLRDFAPHGIWRAIHEQYLDLLSQRRLI